ncbi:hypothetical protein L9F63_021794, partial [Diploptera punctata]
QTRKNKKDRYSIKEFLFNEFLDLKYSSNETIKKRNVYEMQRRMICFPCMKKELYPLNYIP